MRLRVYYRALQVALLVVPLAGRQGNRSGRSMILKRLVAGAVVAGILTVASSLPASPIRVGSSGASKLTAPSRAPSPSDIVATAQQYLGSPYAWIGNTPAGFSCIGFV